MTCSCQTYHVSKDFFKKGLQKDEAVFSALQKELLREQSYIELIASENLVSKAVLDAQGSIFTNKYAEGYPGKRYYHGCEFADEVEQLAIDRAKALFNAAYVNVQPHSGSSANEAVYLALLRPGDTFLGMSLDAGGHLTHGAKVSISGKYFNALSYGVDKETGLIDYDEVRDLAQKHHPKMIIAGGSAYARIIDFKKFREIADEIGAYLMVDMAHFAGLVAGGVYPNPLEFADIVTTTTHKTLRGPRGGIILSNREDLGKKINSAIFPGLQGGPLIHVIAAKAVALKEALDPSFKKYAKQILENAKAMEKVFLERGIDLVSNGTDSHLLLLDLRSHHLTGKMAANSLHRAHITCNKNAVPFDEQKPTITSGLRIGSPAMTTRGFGTNEFEMLAHMIADVLEGLEEVGEENTVIETIVKTKALDLCEKFPIYASDLYL